MRVSRLATGGHLPTRNPAPAQPGKHFRREPDGKCSGRGGCLSDAQERRTGVFLEPINRHLPAGVGSWTPVRCSRTNGEKLPKGAGPDLHHPPSALVSPC